MVRNTQVGKWEVVDLNAFKWVRTNNGPPRGSCWQVPMTDGMMVTLQCDYDDNNIRGIQMHERYKLRG
jgi:hypothetical protein